MADDSKVALSAAALIPERGDFRKKPVVVHAVKWTGDNLREIIEFTGRHPSADDWSWEYFEEVVRAKGLKIFTLEGHHMASVGDWIIEGVRGEFYPCKPDIFAETYEPASSAPSSAAHTKPRNVDDIIALIKEAIDYHDVSDAEADAMDVPASAAYHAQQAKALRMLLEPSAPVSATSFWAEAANAVLEVRDGEVMSKHATAEECRAARDALWKAAEALQNRADTAETKVELRDVVLGEGEPGWLVWLVIGNQQFPVGYPNDVKNEAEWYADMLGKALAGTKSATSFWAEAANAVLEVRDGEVMSKHATAEECRAARDALWKAAEALQNRADSKGNAE